MKNMRLLLAAIALAGLAGLTGCSSKFRAYSGPPITHVYVFKEQRTMVLMSKSQPVATWAVDLGFSPVGHKAQNGDGRTPEGRYYIDRRNPDSAYHLSLGISYPDPDDRAAARAAGRDPGGDIFIHGGPTEARDKGKADWTAGCISVSDREIEEVYSMIRMGTPIDILP
ncbi:MAG: L,D-transpeptidase family protein [Maritimibacter sp.]|nr:L,D-transpeptidase family protein [Maritimibacter sp.]